MPSLKTSSVFSMSVMWVEGSPLMTTRSAFFAGGYAADGAARPR